MKSKRFFIVYQDPDGREKVFHLENSLHVGRSSSCHIFIDREGISRRHCILSLAATGVVLKDQNSTNGTYLNGARIREAVVRPGDRIVVGPCTLRILGEGEAIPDAGQTRLLGQTTIDTLIDGDGGGLPDSTALEEAGLEGDYPSALFQLTEIVNSAMEEGELMEKSLSILMGLFGMDLGSIYRSSEEGGDAEALFTVNKSGIVRYEASSSVLQRVLETHVSLIATDVVDRAGLFKSRSITEPGTACIMCVPMGSAGQVRGAIYLSSLKGQRPFKESALKLLSAMANQIGLALENLAHLEQLRRDNLALRSAMDRGKLVGSSRVMKKILGLVEKVAATDATVLITGESGTGKELIANAIHSASRRAERPMVSINCGAIPESTVESELFGHERGAFTGAVERKFGKFELASEGTLFLDEVGELPLGTQVKLLRALEQRNFYRVGGEKLVKVDVRILAATNSNLETRVEEKVFRSDLLYRLKVFTLHVPPLRDHPEDIPELARFFLDHLGGDRTCTLSKEGLKRLKAYNWPGNVRELKNVLEREMILSEGAELHMASLELGEAGQLSRVGHTASLKEAERAHIIKVLRSVGWNKKEAAKILGIGRPTVYDKIKQYGIREGE